LRETITENGEERVLIHHEQPEIYYDRVDNSRLGSNIVQIEQDWAKEAEIGSAITDVISGSPEESFRKRFFSDVLGSLNKTEQFRSSANDLTKPTRKTGAFVQSFGPKNRQLTKKLLSWLVGFSNDAVQDYATGILVARQDLLAGDDTFTAFEDDLAPGTDGSVGDDGVPEFEIEF